MFQLSYLDPCAGVTCSGGLTALANLGICQCLCGSIAATAIGISLPSNANVCVDGVAKCGTMSSNVAKCTGATPMCLSTATPGATPALGGEASCQVTLWFYSIFFVHLSTSEASIIYLMIFVTFSPLV